MKHDDLFEKRFLGTLTPEEARELKRLLAEDEEARRDFVRFTRERSVLVQLTGRLGEEAAPVRRALPRRTSVPGWVYGAAAAVVFVGLAAFLASLSGPAPVRPTAARVPPPAPEPEAAERRAREEVERLEAEQRRTQERLAALERERQGKAVEQARAEERRKAEEEMARLEARRREAEAELEKTRAAWLKAQEELARKREAARAPPAPPVPAPGETVASAATLESVEGDVRIGGRPAPAGAGLPPGQTLDSVTPASRAALRWADGTRVELAGETSVRDARERDAKRGKGVFVAKGVVTAVVEKQPVDRPMVLATPHGEARVLGTALRVVVADATRVEVREGRVRVLRSSDGRGADVSSGQYALAGAGAPPVARPLFTPRIEEAFEAMPAWSSAAKAAWGPTGETWSVGPGQGGSALLGSRSATGSSANVLVYPVPAHTRVEVSIAMKCPKLGPGSWAETGFRLGTHRAEDFDVNPGAWTLVRKFDADKGPNGNGNAWTVYAAQVDTGSATQLSVGFKLGSDKTAVLPPVGWDSLRISW